MKLLNQNNLDKLDKAFEFGLETVMRLGIIAFKIAFIIVLFASIGFWALLVIPFIL